MRDSRDPRDGETTARALPRAGVTLIAAAVIAVLGVGVVGRLYYDNQRAGIVAQKSSELSAIRDLKIDEIARWKEGLLSDGRRSAHNPAIANEIDDWLADPNGSEAKAILGTWLQNFVRERKYESGILLSVDGSVWLSSERGQTPDDRDLAELDAIDLSAESTITDMFADPATGKPRLDVIAPLLAGRPTAKAVLILHRDPEAILFPLIQGWPTPSPTSETLLVRREDDAVVYLNELRHQKDTALKLRIPITRKNLPAVMALSGPPRVVEGVDYRGRPVLAAIGPVESMGWAIVAKVDVEEAYADVFERQAVAFGATGLLVILVLLGFALAWRQRAAIFYREQLEAERAAAVLEKQYDYLTRYANDVVMLTDETGRIVQVNDAASRVYGYTRDELLDMSLDDLYEPDTSAVAVEKFDEVRRDGSGVFEIRHCRKGGASIEVEISARAISVEGQTLYLSVERDVTERKRAEAELLARTEDLTRSNAELEKFAYVASHDLQEPLRMVASYTQLLKKRYAGQLDADADEFIDYAVDGARRMQNLINDLLAYSRVGTQGAPFSRTDLDRVLADVLKGLEPATEDAGATVTRDPMPTVNCDATQIGQVFQNLISNALKFRRDEQPKIHIGVRRSDGEWVFCVSDNGIGVEPQYFDRIFVIFQRLQSRSEFPGTGMGLAICKRIIDRHGGRIWVESELGSGSTFFFTLRSDRGHHDVTEG